MAEVRPVFLISDLHLNADDAATHAAFSAFMSDIAPQSSHLYVLGDLFEYWPGDDDDDSYNASVIRTFTTLQQQGVPISILPGNRDILMGYDLMTRIGANLLADPTIVCHFGQTLAVSHGDRYCTDDTAYQAFRAMVHSAGWKERFLAQPLAKRREIIAGIRTQSEQAKQEKSLDIMDVNAVAIESAFRELGVNTLIHGHTHRPGKSIHCVDGLHVERWVLPDWQDGRAGYLRWDAAGFSLVTLS